MIHHGSRGFYYSRKAMNHIPGERGFDFLKQALPYSAGKSSNTTLHRRQCGEDTTYTKGKQGTILRAFFLRDLTCTAANAVRRKCCVLPWHRPPLRSVPEA